jgi:hypothetical protein
MTKLEVGSNDKIRMWNLKGLKGCLRMSTNTPKGATNGERADF